MADETKQPDDATPKASWLPGGEPPAPTGAPVAPHSDKPRGERQDGAGIAPPRLERTDATPPGATADERSGERQGGAPGEEPGPGSTSGGDRDRGDATD